MTSLLDQMDVYVLPVFNIDGYDYTHKSVSSTRLEIHLRPMDSHSQCSVDFT
jgi:murein tripeptide amidase MpaA